MKFFLLVVTLFFLGNVSAQNLEANSEDVKRKELVQFFENWLKEPIPKFEGPKSKECQAFYKELIKADKKGDTLELFDRGSLKCKREINSYYDCVIDKYDSHLHENLEELERLSQTAAAMSFYDRIMKRIKLIDAEQLKHRLHYSLGTTQGCNQ